MSKDVKNIFIDYGNVKKELYRITVKLCDGTSVGYTITGVKYKELCNNIINILNKESSFTTKSDLGSMLWQTK